jgi:hypothetical protein
MIQKHIPFIIPVLRLLEIRLTHGISRPHLSSQPPFAMLALSASLSSQNERFPNDPIFRQLLAIARGSSGSIISDPPRGLDLSYDQFLTKVIALRRRVKDRLAPFFLNSKQLLPEKSLICVVAPANHEFAIAAIVILALGGTIVPVRTLTD